MAALLLSLSLSACSGSGSGSGGTKETGGNTPAASGVPTTTFHYVLTAKPTSFDPALVPDIPTSQILQNVFTGLVKNNEKGEVINDLAADIKVSDDGKTYTFTLKDAKFHDGSKVTADDVKRSLLRTMNPAVGSTTASSYLNDITGYAKFLEVRAALDADKKDKKIDDAAYTQKLNAAYAELQKNPGIEAKDEKTVVINIDDAKAYFLAKLTYPTAWVVHKSAPQDKAISAAPDQLKYMIGTGPFKVDSYVDGSKFVLKRWADFYGEKAKVGTVEMPIIEQDQAQMAAYRSGQIDLAYLPTTEYANVKNNPTESKELVEVPSARVGYLAMNEKIFEPFKDVRVRQALNMAVDKVKLNQVVYQGTQFPAYGILPPSIPGALGDKVQKLEFDPAKAKDLLKQAGYGEGGKPLTFKLYYRANRETEQRLAEFMQNQFQTNLGIKISIEPMEWGALLSASVKKDQLDAFLLGWSADYVDPQDFLTILFHTGAEDNRGSFSNKDVDSILDKADRMKPGAERYAEYGKAEQLIVTNAAWVPTTFGKQLYLVKPYVKGVKFSAQWILELNNVEITK